jgi:ureidoacrylate peracid hydrolase
MVDKESGRLGRAANSWAVWPDHVDLRRTLPRSRTVTVDARPQRIRLDLARCALVVVDMQNDFCHPDGWLASIGVDISPARAVIDPVKRAVGWLRDNGAAIIWLNWGNRSDQANLPPGVLHVYDPTGSGVGIGAPARPGGSPTLQAGSWSAALVDELQTAPGDVCIDKFRMSGFFDTELDSVLRATAVTTVFFAGVNSDQCVLATLTDAACLGYDVVLLDDCAGTTSPSYCHDATVYNVAQCFGFVTTAERLMKEEVS